MSLFVWFWSYLVLEQLGVAVHEVAVTLCPDFILFGGENKTLKK